MPDNDAVEGAQHGFLILDKAAGDSSARAIEPVKKRFGKRTKVGHAGTLDPFATGVLIVLVGDATRLSDLAMALPKTYEATVAFGRATDSCDTEGRVVEEADPGASAPDELDERVAEFLGEIQQVPPAFSALKVNGRRAYKLARAGEDVKIAPRRVTVHAIQVVERAWPEITLRVVCGAGFYVRALGRDLGARLDLPAHLTALRRTAIGPFEAKRASEDLRAMEELTAAAKLARIDLDETASLSLAQGRGVSLPEGVSGDPLAVFAPGGLLLGLARAEGQVLQAKTVFSHARRALEQRAPSALPGASLDPHRPLAEAGVKRILFVCVENSCRSQMAEAFVRMHAASDAEAHSAGSRPSGVVNEKAVASMAEVGYDLAAHRSESLNEIPNGPYAAVVTMGCGDACPHVPAELREDWAIPDPKNMDPAEFRQVRDKIEAKVRTLLTHL